MPKKSKEVKGKDAIEEMSLDDIKMYGTNGAELEHDGLRLTKAEQANEQAMKALGELEEEPPPKSEDVSDDEEGELADEITNDGSPIKGRMAAVFKETRSGQIIVEAEPVDTTFKQENDSTQVHARHPKYVNSDKAINAMEEGMKLVMNGKGMYGNMLRKEKLLHSQAHREYTSKEFKELVKICVQFMWNWGKTHSEDPDMAVPSQKAVTQIGGTIIEQFGRRFKMRQKNVFVLKLIGRRNYDLRENKKKEKDKEGSTGKGDGEPKHRHKSREGLGDTVLVGGHNPRLDHSKPMYSDDADEILATSLCPSLVRDIDGIMQPEEEHSTDIVDYVKHFKNRRKGDALSLNDLTVMCNTWCRGE